MSLFDRFRLDGKRLFITGGSGFIGRRLAAVLGGAGYDVVILTRGRPRPPVGACALPS